MAETKDTTTLAVMADPLLEQKLARMMGDEGVIRAKARVLVQELVLQTAFNVLADADTHQSTKLEWAKYLTRLAGLDQAAPVGSGGGFSISINIPAAPPNTLTPARAAQTVIIEHPPQGTLTSLDDDLPPPPEGFRVPDFKLDLSLVGTAGGVSPQPMRSISP